MISNRSECKRIDWFCISVSPHNSPSAPSLTTNINNSCEITDHADIVPTIAAVD